MNAVYTGLAAGLDSVTQRKRRDAIEDERLKREIEKHGSDMESGRFGLDAARAEEAHRTAMRPLEVETAQVGLGDARYQGDRRRTTDTQADQDRTRLHTKEDTERDALNRAADQEGALDFVRTFDRTKDIDLAVKAFNAKGRSKIKTFKATPDGQGDFDIEFDETDGDVTREKWSTLRRLLPPEPLTKIGKDDRLVRTGPDGKPVEVLGPNGGDGRSGEYSKFGPAFFRDSSERFFGKQDPKTGGIIWPAGGREKASEASSIAERLYLDHQVDPNESARLANLSVGFDLSEADIKARLRDEAIANGVTNPEQYAAVNVERYRREANTARNEIERITRSKGRGAPGQGASGPPKAPGAKPRAKLVEATAPSAVQTMLSTVKEGQVVQAADQTRWVRRGGKVYRVE